MSNPLPDSSSTRGALDGLTTFEQEIIELFVRGAQLLSLPKSVGEIYGLLYSSEHPLTLDQIVELLRISKGSASQGLRFLSGLAAVRKVYVPGDRRDHYEAEVRLRRLGEGLLRERVDPHIQSGQERLERLEVLADDLSPHLKERFQRLKKWHTRARRMMPFLRRIFPQ
jgi:DNA-binding transcriptional regulator GbsR (MarR family)|tara:strand:+ start:4264 stop:4770 length:507 start_codon:yes stop_codon:yes gene_type:complete